MARYRLSVSSVEVSCWMKIVFNSVASIDIKNALSVDQVFEGAIAEEIVKYDFSSKVRLIVFHPVILDPAVGVMPDGASYKRAENAAQVSVNIPHEKWVTVDKVQRNSL